MHTGNDIRQDEQPWMLSIHLTSQPQQQQQQVTKSVNIFMLYFSLFYCNFIGIYAGLPHFMVQILVEKSKISPINNNESP